MFGTIKKIFSKSSAKKSVTTKQVRNIESYFRDELIDNEYIKTEAHEIVMTHLCHKTNLNKTGNKLTADEKRKICINTRLSITHELVAVLTDSGLAQNDPKDILSSLYSKATFAKNHDDSMEQYRSIGVKFYKIMGCDDERDCKWCKSMDGEKVSIGQDFNSLIKNNCKCESHCRLVTTAVVEF